MPELKDHLYILLANNIIYNAAFDVFATSTDIAKTAIKKTNNNETKYDLPLFNGEESEDEDFYIDTLTLTDLPFLVYGVCFSLTAFGSRNALPALIRKQETADSSTIVEITQTMKSIQKREGITEEQMQILKSPAFRRIQWKESALAFFCQYHALATALNMDMEDSRTIELGDFLIRELNVNLDGHDSIDSYRICYVDTEAYRNEMKSFDKKLRSEVFLGSALKGTSITECYESEFQQIYHELMNEFLNVRIMEKFRKGSFGS
jgi:hypothetical protein